MTDTANLLKSWNSEFQARCDRVRHLIGDRHWLSDGRHKEDIVSDHLRKYVGPAWQVGSGFIVGDGGAAISPEVDVYLDDPRASPPLLCDGSIRIVPAEGVAAFVEVKSTLTKPVLDEVTAHQMKVLATLRNMPHSVWCGAVFFQQKGGQKGYLQAVRKHLERAREDGLLRHERQFCFVVLGHHVTFLDSSNSLSTPRLKMFPAGDLSIALALGDLFDFLACRQPVPTRHTMLQDMINSLDFDAPTLMDLMAP